ncbi:MAG: V-type ATPase subunit [Chloroflexi bacterium]|nr:V-type ATPase subunit [Chloroflexota bacterium]
MDDDYGYGNARLRAMKSRLLTRNDYATLLDEPNVEAMVAQLTHTAYQPAIEAALVRASGWDCLAQGLRRHLATALARIGNFFSDKPQRLWQILIARYQVFNLKTILRGQALTIPADEILDTIIPMSDLREADLRRLVQQTSVRAVVDVLATWHHPYAPALLQAMPRYAEQRDLADVELALDRARYTLAFTQLDEQDDDNGKLVRKILQREIDVTNLLTVIRLSEWGGSAARLAERYGSNTSAALLLKGGGLATQRLLGLSTLPAFDQVVREMHLTEFGAVLSRAQERYNETHALVTFEDELETFSMQENLALFHNDPLTIGIAIAYLTALVNEIRNLRVIGRGKLAGWTHAEIEKELRLWPS